MKRLTTAIPVVDVESFKRSIHMPSEETADDLLLGALVRAAIAVVETATGHPMEPVDVEFALPAGDYCKWWFPVRPVNSLSEVKWRVDGADWQGAGSPNGSYLIGAHDEPCLNFPQALRDRLAAATEITAVANVGGWVSEQQNQAVIMLAKEWRDAGIALEAVQENQLSFAVKNLIRQVRYRRPKVTE